MIYFCFFSKQQLILCLEEEKVDRELEKFDTLFGRRSSSSAKGQLSELDAFIKKTHPDVQFKARERKFDLCRRELGKVFCLRARSLVTGNNFI